MTNLYMTLKFFLWMTRGVYKICACYYIILARNISLFFSFFLHCTSFTKPESFDKVKYDFELILVPTHFEKRDYSHQNELSYFFDYFKTNCEEIGCCIFTNISEFASGLKLFLSGIFTKSILSALKLNTRQHVFWGYRKRALRHVRFSNSTSLRTILILK